jgi:hypothetical protein
MDGPTLVVIWFEVVSDAVQPVFHAAPVPNAVPVAAQVAAAQPVPMPASPPTSLPSAQLDFVGSPPRPPLKIVKPSIWIGREKDCDVIFHSATATVSRRHAEIAFEAGDFFLRTTRANGLY